MSKTIVRPTLSLGNHIYLYRLLRDAIGCGKQTFMTQIEEALAAGDMTAYDLGFESTRELLEELDDCIKLTVFKGGRLYATVIANEAWDVALAKGEDEPKAAKGAKQSYKKKKRGEKDLKAVRPKHVKRPEPEPAAEVEVAPESEAEAEAAAEAMTEAEATTVAEANSEVVPEQETATEQDAESTEEADEATAPAAEEPADQPAAPAFQNSDVFGDGSADVLFSGTRSAKDVKEALGDNYAATSLPTFTVNGQKKQMKSFAATKAAAYNPNAKNPKAAAQFAAYLGSTEAQKLHYEMRAIPPTDKSLSDLTTDDIAAKAQADTMANTALLQSGLSGMNDWWTPAETFGKALVNKEITKDNAAAKYQDWVKQAGGKIAE